MKITPDFDNGKERVMDPKGFFEVNYIVLVYSPNETVDGDY